MTELTGIVGTVEKPALSQSAVEWSIRERHISRETLERLGVRSGITFFPEDKLRHESLFFPFSGGSWQARSIEGKAFVTNPGFKRNFFNIDRVLEVLPSTVYITEGCMDACALVEAGIPEYQVLAITGSQQKPAKDLVKGYAFIDDALRAGLANATRFVWCGDNDPSGIVLRDDVCRVLGAARFMFIEWPEGIKDANQFLIERGSDALHTVLTTGMRPWPVHGLFRMGELIEPPPLQTWSTGFPSWDDKIKIAPRTLSVVTGQPGHGKTQLFQQIWYQIAYKYDLVGCMASFETKPKPHLRRQLRRLYPGPIEEADAWIEQHYLYLVHPEGRPTLPWFMEMAEVAVIRHGAKFIQLDPWNRLEAARDRSETETEYILRVLREMHQFAQDMDVHVQIIAHPAKVDSRRRGQAPELEDISGSKHWDNVVDQGFVIHRPVLFEDGVRKTECKLIQKKARLEELGYVCEVDLNYIIDNGAYISIESSDMVGQEGLEPST